jgi:hypothetical protein
MVAAMMTTTVETSMTTTTSMTTVTMGKGRCLEQASDERRRAK